MRTPCAHAARTNQHQVLATANDESGADRFIWQKLPTLAAALPQPHTSRNSCSSCNAATELDGPPALPLPAMPLGMAAWTAAVPFAVAIPAAVLCALLQVQLLSCRLGAACAGYCCSTGGV